MDTKSQQGKRRRILRPTTVDGFSLAKARPTRQRATTKAATNSAAQVNASKKLKNQSASQKQRLAVEAFPLPRYHAPDRPKSITHKKTSKLMLALRGASLVVTLFVLTGGFLVWKGYGNFHKVFHGTTTVAALSSKPVNPELLSGEGDGRVNILLLGVGGAGHDGPDLTDTMLVLSVDPVNNTAALLSVPRDLWVKMPTNYFGSTQKINAAYESGKYSYLGKLDASNANTQAVQAGFTAADTVMSQVLGLKINYHVLVNFQAFRQAIDTVGGITVNVPTDLIDPTMAWENGNSSLLAKAGVQQMNGVKALLYARSRETTSDFARTERQRQIIIALKDKVLSAGTLSNPAKIEGLMNAFGNNVYSDLSPTGAVRLSSILKQVSDTKINSIGLAQAPNNFVTTDYVGTASVVRPVAGFNNYTAIQNYIKSQLPDGYLVKEKAMVRIIAPTTVSASVASATLTTYGYTVGGSSVATVNSARTIVVDLSAGASKYTRHYLEARYGVTAVTKLPTGVTPPPTGTKFVIINPT